MPDYNGVIWRVNYGEISERNQFRVGYVGQQSFDGYFELGQLSDLITVLNAVQSAPLNQLIKGSTVQARKASDGIVTRIIIEPRMDNFPPQIMSLASTTLSDLIYALQLLQTALSGAPIPDDWDGSYVKPYVWVDQKGVLQPPNNAIAIAVQAAEAAVAAAPAAVSAAITAEDIHGKITADIGSRNLVQSTDGRLPQITSAPGTVAAITDAEGNPTFMQASDIDGGPNPAADSILRARYPGLGETFDVPGTSVAILDKDGNLTWLEANDIDGGPTPRALAALRTALAGQPSTSILVTNGDSMTELSQGGGTGPWPAQVATNTGHTVINLGRSGAWAAEVCTRAGGIAPLITLPAGVLPADTTPLAVTVDGYGGWSNMSDLTRGVFGTIRGVRFRLTYETTGGFKITRVTAGSAVEVASPVSFTPDTPYLTPAYVHTLWVGRNNVSNGTDAYTPISRQVDEFRRSGVKFLLFSVCNTSPYGATTGEPSGSANYNTIVALNLQLQKLAPREYVDIRGRLIREGLALAGLTPTSGDTSDIAADMIPRSLLDDGLHPSSAGRVAIAAIVQDELTIRNLI